jgi:hypothetical protein
MSLKIALILPGGHSLKNCGSLPVIPVLYCCAASIVCRYQKSIPLRSTLGWPFPINRINFTLGLFILIFNFLGFFSVIGGHGYLCTVCAR